MALLSTEATVAVVGLAGFQIWQAWRETAPSFYDLRQAHPGDIPMSQALLDSSLTVGTLALGLGVAFAVLSHDMTALILMAVIFGILALWSHQILAAPKVSNP